MKIVHHHANGCFDWLIFGQQSVNPSREAISILSGNTKHLRFSILCVAIFSKSNLFVSINALMNDNCPEYVCSMKIFPSTF